MISKETFIDIAIAFIVLKLTAMAVQVLIAVWYYQIIEKLTEALKEPRL